MKIHGPTGQQRLFHVHKHQDGNAEVHPEISTPDQLDQHQQLSFQADKLASLRSRMASLESGVLEKADSPDNLAKSPGQIALSAYPGRRFTTSNEDLKVMAHCDPQGGLDRLSAWPSSSRFDQAPLSLTMARDDQGTTTTVCEGALKTTIVENAQGLMTVLTEPRDYQAPAAPPLFGDKIHAPDSQERHFVRGRMVDPQPEPTASLESIGPEEGKIRRGQAQAFQQMTEEVGQLEGYFQGHLLSPENTNRGTAAGVRNLAVHLHDHFIPRESNLPEQFRGQSFHVAMNYPASGEKASFLQLQASDHPEQKLTVVREPQGRESWSVVDGAKSTQFAVEGSEIRAKSTTDRVS